jgi:hypothetical protein
LTDFSNGLDPAREATLTSPPEAYCYAENLMLAGFSRREWDGEVAYGLTERSGE